MDQKKFGSFLRELRKEKQLTQEQLAERFGVTSRSVSRWETGSNMPDLSILVELADFYDVDIRDIIDGERKGEDMNKEEKERLQLVADYAETEKNTLLMRLRIFSIVGLISLIAGLTMMVISRLPERLFPDIFLIKQKFCHQTSETVFSQSLLLL